MPCGGLGLLWGWSVTRCPTACPCHRGHHSLLAASHGSSRALLQGMLWEAELCPNLVSSDSKISPLWKGRACPELLSLSLLHLSPVEARDVGNEE